MDIKNEARALYELGTREKYKSFIKELDTNTSAKARAILDILEIGETSIANAKFILHLCEDTLERCTAVSITTDV